MQFMLSQLRSSRFSASIWSVLVLVLIASVFAVLRSPAAAQHSAPDPASDPRGAALDVDFLMGMIPHHRGAIMMAELAATKATQPELRELARKIVATQELEIELMTNWLRNWYGVQPPAGHMISGEMMRNMHMPMMRDLMPDMDVRMQALEAQRGSAFDVVFMSSMIDRHAMAVMMASPVLIAGHHQALTVLASQMVIDQGEEIKQMQEWLGAWYNVKRTLSKRP